MLCYVMFCYVTLRYVCPVFSTFVLPHTAQADSRDQQVDPWAPLDAHDPGASKARPLRKGRPYRLPPQLRKRRGLGKGLEKVGEGEEEAEDDGGSWVTHDGKLK